MVRLVRMEFDRVHPGGGGSGKAVRFIMQFGHPGHTVGGIATNLQALSEMMMIEDNVILVIESKTFPTTHHLHRFVFFALVRDLVW